MCWIVTFCKCKPHAMLYVSVTVLCQLHAPFVNSSFMLKYSSAHLPHTVWVFGMFQCKAIRMDQMHMKRANLDRMGPYSERDCLLWQCRSYDSLGSPFGQRIKVINWALSDTIILPAFILRCFPVYSVFIICLLHSHALHVTPVDIVEKWIVCKNSVETKPGKGHDAQSFISICGQAVQDASWSLSSKAHASAGRTGEQKTPLLFIICCSRDGIRFLLCAALQRIIFSFNCSMEENNAESQQAKIKHILHFLFS